MTETSSFVTYVLEILDDFGTVRARAMFGGHGIYRDGLIFAIVVDDTLYIKADDRSRHLFEEQGLARFSYKRSGKDCFMSYYMPPEEALEDRDELYYWAVKGYEAALRSKK